jgi:hypothetical protein
MRHCHRHGFLPKLPFLIGALGVYLITRGGVAVGVLLIVFAATRLGERAFSPRRRLARRIADDATRFGCPVPHDENVMDGLEAVYAKHASTTAAYPQLASTYDELLESMWIELRTTTRLSEWRRIVRDVAQGWPAPWGQGESPVAESMRRAQRAARQWREAQREAAGHPVI